jgi:hypothetical protein
VTDDHLSLDEIAELDEGLLPLERISAIRAHLHGCEQCRSRADAITSTRSMLANLPAVTMPDDVKARLDRVIAEEAGRTAEEAGSSAEQAGSSDKDESDEDEPAEPAAVLIDHTARSADVTPRLATVIRPRFGRPTMASSAAAAAIVLAFGAIIFAHYHHNGGSNNSGAGLAQSAAAPSGVTAATGSAQPKNFVQTSTGQDYTPASLISTVPGLIASTTENSPTVPNPAAPPTPASSDSAAAGGAGTSSGTAGSAAGGTTTAGAKHSATKSGKRTTSAPLAAAAPETLVAQPVPQSLQPLYHSRQKLLRCAAFLSGVPDAVPLAIDFGRWTNGTFHNAPSAIFIFRDTDPSVVDVYVTGPKCDDNSLRTFVKVPAS